MKLFLSQFSLIWFLFYSLLLILQDLQTPPLFPYLCYLIVLHTLNESHLTVFLLYYFVAPKVNGSLLSLCTSSVAMTKFSHVDYFLLMSLIEKEKNIE